MSAYYGIYGNAGTCGCTQCGSGWSHGRVCQSWHELIKQEYTECRRRVPVISSSVIVTIVYFVLLCIPVHKGMHVKNSVILPHTVTYFAINVWKSTANPDGADKCNLFSYRSRFCHKEYIPYKKKRCKVTFN
ncbi:hypothetical protein AAFF_G00126240 [Aldrovandia affinis]|uniref:Uncharacterized protein n=1 Tax=Aldrovandia affinis TaxID=143900 RepID=A0AAD7RR38_9TELE|nr:hypothetical protein AAFF_G00126240 [Aldrovandia affinis]